MKMAAVAVNHNTSAYMELMLRSLVACHRTNLPLSLTIMDNGSTDDMGGLMEYAAEMGVPVLPSGFPLNTVNNSHGEILGRFVLDHPDCTHYLFLDADVCFVQPDTLLTMLAELEREPSAFGIGPRLSWDGVAEIPAAIRAGNPDICDARLHPCCALVRNTPVFRRVVEHVGLMGARRLWADRDEYLDTFKLLTLVMATHGWRHSLSSALVQHFFCVSYEYDDPATRRYKAELRDGQLARLRRSQSRAKS